MSFAPLDGAGEEERFTCGTADDAKEVVVALEEDPAVEGESEDAVIEELGVEETVAAILEANCVDDVD